MVKTKEAKAPKRSKVVKRLLRSAKASNSVSDAADLMTTQYSALAPAISAQPLNLRILWNAAGVAGETGELLSEILRKKPNKPNIRSEWVDCFSFAITLASEVGMDCNALMKKTIVKNVVATNRPNKYGILLLRQAAALSEASKKLVRDGTPERTAQIRRRTTKYMRLLMMIGALYEIDIVIETRSQVQRNCQRYLDGWGQSPLPLPLK